MAYESTRVAAALRSGLAEGVAAHRSGDLERALAAYRHVLDLAPDHGPALSLLGTVLLQLGRAPEALPLLERAARRLRGDANVLGNLAQAYLALGRYTQAADTFRKASRTEPSLPQFHVGVAAALALDGKLAEAGTLLARLTARFPDAPLVWLNRGHVLRDTQRVDESIEAYRRALALDPTLIEARVSLGSVLHSAMRLDEARTEYEACIERAPDYLIAWFNLASLHMACGRFADAQAVCRTLIAKAPAQSEAHRLMGTALAHSRRLMEALASYRRAAELTPDDPAAARSYGGLLVEVGEALNGARWLARAAALEPDSVHTHRILSGALLANGRLQDGWLHHAHRPGAAELRASHHAWLPESALPAGHAQIRLCVIGEQGLGDELFFLRYVPQLVARGSYVTVRCSSRIAPLLRRVDGFPEVLGDETAVPEADVRILCGDLPLALGHAEQSPVQSAPGSPRPALREYAQSIRVYWPAPAPSLLIPASSERTAEVRARLAALGRRPYIGMTWRAGIAPEDQHGGDAVLYKSIEPEALAAALASTPGTVVALQRRPGAGELARASQALGREVHDLTALNDDLESMLALLEALDEYVGVSNTNMHLRASAGRTARVLVPAPAEWRWMHFGPRSPWFPGFSIYRQSLQGDWTNALAALRSDLALNYGSVASSKIA